MLKKLLKPIRKQLLKFAWIKRAVSDSLLRLKEERNRKRWAQLMSAGYTIRKDAKPINYDLSEKTEDDVIVEYSDGRMIGQRHVTPIIIRPFGMRRGE